MTTTTSNTSSTSGSSFDYTALNGTSSTTTSKTADAQTRFLKLLTTQLQNQDPLNPVDNAQMTTQIAQLNMVDGINTLNTSMQGVLSAMNGSQAMQAASIVGHGVLVPGSALTLTEATSTTSAVAVGGYKLESAADKVNVTIKDSNGTVVRSVSLGEADAGVNAFSWDGKNDEGVAQAAGNYTVSFEATQGGNAVKVSALTLGTVSSVTNGTDGLTINVGGRGSYKLSEVEQIF